MQINVVNTGSPMGFDFLLYPDQHPTTQQYLREQVSNFSNTLTDTGRQFLTQAKHMYEQFNNSSAVRMAKAAVKAAKAIFHPNTIVPLSSIEEFRHAQPMMQRWVMAEPTIRTLYQDNRCDGYYGTYFDMDPGATGWDHYDYRRVMDTIMRFDGRADEEIPDNWVCRNALEELIEDDTPLDFHDRVHILSSWDMLKMFVEAGTDPTNPDGGDINTV